MQRNRVFGLPGDTPSRLAQVGVGVAGNVAKRLFYDDLPNAQAVVDLLAEADPINVANEAWRYVVGAVPAGVGALAVLGSYFSGADIDKSTERIAYERVLAQLDGMIKDVKQHRVQFQEDRDVVVGQVRAIRDQLEQARAYYPVLDSDKALSEEFPGGDGKWSESLNAWTSIFSGRKQHFYVPGDVKLPPRSSISDMVKDVEGVVYGVGRNRRRKYKRTFFGSSVSNYRRSGYFSASRSGKPVLY